MTIHIQSMRDCDPAAVKEGYAKCAKCEGTGYGDTFEMLDDLFATCARCSGLGEVRYHDLSRYALACPFRPGNEWEGPSIAECVGWYERRLREHFGWPRPNAESAALSAIQPGDVLVHDGTELGAACAEVVRKIALERINNGN